MDAKKTKPFPWMCPECRVKTVLPVQTNYMTSAVHDGVSYEIILEGVMIPTCTQCGQIIITNEHSEQITAELRRLAGLLAPERIRAKREALGLTQAEVAHALRIAESTLKRWESGMQLQPGAMDLLLRLYFDSAEVRGVCATVAAIGAAVSSSTT